MIRNAILPKVVPYYPIGNTLAVCLTQDLPPEQDADILLLGCGDARNVLFTCFADTGRKIDVTCCDIEPGIHARNVLLYTLLIEDKTNDNIELIWNIYYHWRIDTKSQELLETQIHKLLQVSESMDQWDGSVYGSCIRFCDSRSLSCTRSYWIGFQLQGLTLSEEVHRRNQLETAINNAKCNRNPLAGSALDTFGIHATSPAGIGCSKTLSVLNQATELWWDTGTTTSSHEPALQASELNPALLYSPNKSLMLNPQTTPLYGFPLSSFLTPTIEGASTYLKCETASSVKCLVDSAKSHFSLWAKAFRHAVTNKIVIRIFSGDALAFGLTLRNLQATMSTNSRAGYQFSKHLFAHSNTSSLLKLDHDDYDGDKKSAPVSFNIVETSNLADYLGLLNLLPIGASLLKLNASSCLYTGTLFLLGSYNLVDRLNGSFGVDARCMSLLLGLVPVELFTNATNVRDEDLMMRELSKLTKVGPLEESSPLRWRWRRLLRCKESCDATLFQVDAKTLANLLVRVHDAMIKDEDTESIIEDLNLSNPYAMFVKLRNYMNPIYNRASFALLLNFIRGNIVTDWNECVECIFDSIYSHISPRSKKFHYAREFILNMQLYGVGDCFLIKPEAPSMINALLAPFLPTGVAMSDQLCVTIRVSRKELEIFTSINDYHLGNETIYCIIESGERNEYPWCHHFSAVKLAFGTWCEQSGDEGSIPHIDEDDSQLSGASDMFVSFLIPAMLISQPGSTPWVSCGINPPAANNVFSLPKRGPYFRFASRKMFSEDVFITQFMPGMSGLPVFTLAGARYGEPPTASTNTIRFSHDGSKVEALIQRITLECEVIKAKLAVKSSSVIIQFKSPLMAIVRIAQTHELEFEFPVPVSPSKYKLRIARQSSYIEVETPLYDPLKEDNGTFIFPILFTKSLSGEIMPTPWTSTRIDMDSLPTIDVGNMHAIPWFRGHVSSMFSMREAHTRKNSKADIRTQLKNGIFSIFMHYTGLQAPKSSFFELRTAGSEYRTLIFPSCLRLDLVNHTVVLDCVIIPLTSDLSRETRVSQFLSGLTACGLVFVDVSLPENRAWRALMPAFVERCRTANTWKHAPACEYQQGSKTLHLVELREDHESPICSCGVGKFPPGNFRRINLPGLEFMVTQYGTRAAIAPIFAIRLIEDCTGFSESKINTSGLGIGTGVRLTENCANCGKSREENYEAGEWKLMTCSRCKTVKYCSVVCQKANWKQHKPQCSAF